MKQEPSSTGSIVGRHPRQRRWASAVAAASAVAIAVTACSSSGDDAGGGGNSGGTGSLTSLTYAMTGSAANWAQDMLIKDNPGMCAQFGVKPNVTVLTTAAAAPALVANQIQMADNGIGSNLLADLKNPGAIKIVAQAGPLPLVFYGTKSITSIDQLKGKTVGASSRGATGDLALRQFLLENNLQDSVKISYAGTSSSLIGLIASGSIAGIIYDPPLPDAATQAGVHQLKVLAGDPQIDPLGTDTIGANATFLAKNRDAVKGMLRCIDYAQKQVLADPNKAAAVLAKVQSASVDSAKAQIMAMKDNYVLKPIEVDAAKTVISALQRYGIDDFGNFDPNTAVETGLI